MLDLEMKDSISGCQEVSSNCAGRLPEASLLEWFAVAVKPRHDKAVVKALEAKGLQTFLPLCKRRHRYATRVKESEIPLFPGYVFTRFNVLARLPILTTPGVIQILGNAHGPLALPETEIISLQIAVRSQLLLQPFPFPQVGQKVRIDGGSLAGIEGTVISLKHPLRLVLSVALLQRSVLLEIDRDQVSVQQISQLGG